MKLERLLTKNTSCTFEPSLATVSLRFTGLSGFLLIVALISFAGLRMNASQLAVYQWAIPLAFWLLGVVLLFVGAVRAFGNAPEKVTTLTVLKICQWVAWAYFGLCLVFAFHGNESVMLTIRSVFELYFVMTTLTFLAIAALTRAALARSVWLDVIVAFGAAALTFKHLVDFLRVG